MFNLSEDGAKKSAEENATNNDDVLLNAEFAALDRSLSAGSVEEDLVTDA